MYFDQLLTSCSTIKLQRRTFLTLTLGWCSALFALGASLAAAGRFLVPNVLYEPNRRFKALKPEDYPEGPTFLPNLRVFLFREGKSSAPCRRSARIWAAPSTWRARAFTVPATAVCSTRTAAVVSGPAPSAAAVVRADAQPGRASSHRYPQPIKADQYLVV